MKTAPAVAAICLTLSVLAACAPALQPVDLVRIEPSLTPDHFITDDGAVLPLKTWMPHGSPRAVIVALHGFNDYSNAFAQPAQSWVGCGIATYAFDQRGFGGAPYRGRWAGTDRMARDAALAVRLIERRHPQLPVYLLGESMGGAVALAAMTGSDPPPVAGLILVAPAARGRVALGRLASATLWVADHTLPWYPLTGEGLNIRPSDNHAMLRALSVLGGAVNGAKPAAPTSKTSSGSSFPLKT